MDRITEKILELDNYENRLQEEMKAIEGFKDEVPLCMKLLDGAMSALKEEKMRCQNQKVPILEEFLPMKKSSPGDEDEKIGDGVKETDIVDRREKMSWMSLVRLWNTDSDSNEKREEESVDRAAVETGKEGRDEWLSLGHGIGTPEKKDSLEDNTQSPKKQRRCWTPELHTRFVSALQKLGGAQVATPKQIVERMRADGSELTKTLTTEEVKSHLQKYRIHTKGTGESSSKPVHSRSRSLQRPIQLAGGDGDGDGVEDEDDGNKSDTVV